MSANSQSQMLYRGLGNTGEKVSAIGLGGWHIGLPSVDDAGQYLYQFYR